MPQHITDLLAGDTDGRFLTSLTELINLLFSGKFDTEINTIIYSGRFLAMSKKDGGAQPIAVGDTIRGLAAKCANRHVIEEPSSILQPRQVGVGVAGGAEAAVHAMRRYLKLLPVGHAIIKLDLTKNAFNSIRRDLQLDTMAKNMPELYRFTLVTYSCEPALIYGDQMMPSRDGSQQGESMSSLEFCEAIQPVLNNLDSEVNIGLMDDVSLSSDVSTLEKDINTITEAESSTELRLNPAKCEIIMNDFRSIETMNVFKDFITSSEEPDDSSWCSTFHVDTPWTRCYRKRWMALTELLVVSSIYKHTTLWYSRTV